MNCWRSEQFPNVNGRVVMPELKRLSKAGVAAALVMADRYRLLFEPGEAESICLDVLEGDGAVSGAVDVG
jgi:hypothetical protein